jgi:hypothetical protein
LTNPGELDGVGHARRGHDIHATGCSLPSGFCVSDFAGSFTHLEPFGGLRFLGNSIYCDNSGSGNPALRSYLSSAQWSDNQIEGKAGTVGASLHGDHFVFSANYVNTSYMRWAILADWVLSGTAGSLTSFATKSVGARPGGHDRQSIAPVSASEILSQRPYQPFCVAATPSLFGVAAAGVTDVSGKTLITSIEVNFDIASRRATVCFLNGVTETTDKPG